MEIELIANFIENSQKFIKRENRGHVTEVELDNKFFIEELDSENVSFYKENGELYEVDIAKLRDASPRFNELCVCPSCQDEGGYNFYIGDEQGVGRCEHDYVAFGCSELTV